MMRTTRKLFGCLLAAGILATPLRLSAADSPYDVGNKSQLFVDQLLVNRADRVWFTQHKGTKHPQNPLLKADQPWEGWRIAACCGTLYDNEDKLFKMWYLDETAGSSEDYFGQNFVICYATSRDGVRWQKPSVGTLIAKNKKPHNAVAAMNGACVFKDLREADPSRRYKMIGKISGGFNTLVSADGLNWKRLSTSPIAKLRADAITGLWYDARQLYVAFPKQLTLWRGCERRVFHTITSKDFINWSEPVLSWTPDLRDDAGSLARIEEARPLLDRPDNPKLMRTEFYAIGACAAESCLIGFPWIFTVNNDARWGNQEGVIEVQLAASRDAIHWERPFRTPVIGRDKLDSWDAGMHATDSAAMRVGDEIRLYYGGENSTHGTPALYREKFKDGTPTGRKTKHTASIGLVTWKLDRFVSVDGPAEGGTLTTIPIKFSGQRLEINAATRPGGSVVVELCDAAGKPLAGFGPSDPFRGDDLRHIVTFQGNSTVAALAGKPVVLRLHLKSAELYSFAFRESVAESPFDVGNKSQLFVDQLLVRQTDGVWFTQHEGTKHPQNPLLKADQPWEGWRVELFGSALYDQEEKLFKMWYLADPDGDSKYFDIKGATCYATSADGIRWQKPLVGTLPAKNGKPHNAVVFADLTSVVKDPKDPDPSQRYKMIARTLSPQKRHSTLVSPDGLRWKPFSAAPISAGGDVITGLWNEALQLYVAFPKQYLDWRGHKRRLFGTITSKDFVYWSEPILSWTPDLRDDAGSLARIEQARPLLDRPDNPKLMRTEFYGIGAYAAESCIVGFPWILTVNNDARWGNQEGPMEVQLAVSRDAIHWERPFRTPLIGRDGPEAWDAGCHTTSAAAFRFGDEIRLYYGGANYTHGTPVLYRENFDGGKSTGRKTKYTASIGLVTWKLDRFVSVDGPVEGGTLTTIPLTFSGKRLEINAATKPGGAIIVELLDAVGRPLPGFSPSQPFSGDQLRHHVVFAGKKDISSLAGKPITLRFRIADASLYSFAFRE